MAIIRRPHDGALLVSEGPNPSGEIFHRPLGGHVEFGEYAADTLHREFQEEIGQTLTEIKLMGVLENIFQWNGAMQHEIVFVYTAALADGAGYEINEQKIIDSSYGTRVIWRPSGSAIPIYPEGVATIAEQAVAQRFPTH